MHYITIRLISNVYGDGENGGWFFDIGFNLANIPVEDSEINIRLPDGKTKPFSPDLIGTFNSRNVLLSPEGKARMKAMVKKYEHLEFGKVGDINGWQRVRAVLTSDNLVNTPVPSQIGKTDKESNEDSFPL